MKTTTKAILAACLTAGSATAETWIPLFNGKEFKGGENSASGDPMSGLEWVTIEAEVRGGEEITHLVNGKEVLRYQHTMLQDGTPQTSGYIAIQAETHPTEFRKIELLPLPGNQSVPNGMTSLFDGKSLDGWKPGPKSEGHWKVIDGVIDYDALAGEHLWTEESFGAFELHFQGPRPHGRLQKGRRTTTAGMTQRCPQQ